MHRRVWFLAAAAVGVLALASSAAAMRTTSKASRSLTTTSFAKGFASIPRTPAARAANKTVNFAMEQDAGGFNLANQDFTGAWAAYFGETPEIRGNYIIDNKGQYHLDLASKVQVTKKYMRITIRKNANWNWLGHKPFPVTAADYVYTWQQLNGSNVKNNVASTAGYNLITRAKVHGSKQVTFYWKKPFADYKDLFGYIYPSKALAGQNFNTFWSDCVCGYPDKHPITDGPYYLQSWTPGAGLILKSNNKWYGKKPTVTTIVGKLYSQESSEINAFAAGEVDAIYPGQPITSMAGLLHKSGVKHVIVPGYTQEHIDLEFGAAGSAQGGTHTANGAYLESKKWFDQALAMGLNRQPVINAVYAGVLPKNFVKPLNNPFYMVGPLATAKKYQYFAKYSNKPAAAIALLKKHGCKGGPSKASSSNNKYWTCGGHTAEIGFYTTTAPARCNISMPAWIEQEKSIGIKLDGKCYNAQPDFFTNLLPTGKFDMAEYAFSGAPDPALWDDIYGCVTATRGGQNYKNYCDKKVNKLMTKADSELNPTKRAAEYQAAAKLVSSDVAIIPLYARPSFLFYNSKIQGMNLSDNPTSVGPLWNAQNWKWSS